MSKSQNLYYNHILTDDILRDVCQRITGRTDFTTDFVDDVNIGRLATLEYKDSISYISFSELKIEGRNSALQSFSSAYAQYFQEANLNKQICFYFLQTKGNIQTHYFIFMYRLMKTAGTVFLNESDHLTINIALFNSVSDIIAQRDLNRDRNTSNASTYVTIDENNTSQIYGKTYGANKYETALLCLAIRKVTQDAVELYEIKEGGLRKLPASAREIILSLEIN